MTEGVELQEVGGVMGATLTQMLCSQTSSAAQSVSQSQPSFEVGRIVTDLGVEQGMVG